jgi:hypothetical protein
MTLKNELHELRRITRIPSTASRSGTDYSQSSVNTLIAGTPFSTRAFLKFLIIAGGPEIK